MERADLARDLETGSMPVAQVHAPALVAEEWSRYCSNNFTDGGGPGRCSGHRRA